MNILILDDELHARITIKSYLNKLIGTNHTVKEAGDIDGAIAITKVFSPDLAFLDVNLNGGTSFDFLAILSKINFKIIFISGYDQYAVRAFRFNAIDYILKPIIPKEFKEAVNKAITSSSQISAVELDKLTSDLQSNRIEKIVLKDIHSVHFVTIDEIIYCQSENNYTSFFLIDGSEITVSKTLKGYEKILRPLGFFRSHRSFLINLKLVKSFDKKEGGSLKMIDSSLIPIARNKKDTFIKIMKV